MSGAAVLSNGLHKPFTRPWSFVSMLMLYSVSSESYLLSLSKNPREPRTQFPPWREGEGTHLVNEGAST